MSKKFVVWFSDVGKDDGALVGGKGANLGEMTQAGFPVPPGFIVTSKAYERFLDESGLRACIKDVLYGLDVSDSDGLEQASKDIQKSITQSRFPHTIAKEVIEAYFSMDEGLSRHSRVAVRSSATAEDLPGASFAGQQSTFLNVEGEASLLEKIKEAWASLFTARAIFYRKTQGFDDFKVGIAIPVQKMVESVASGIMFTLDPVTNSKSTIVIEGIFGLGEMIVQGAVTPDHYEVDKKSLIITAKSIKTQEKQMIRAKNENIIEQLSHALGSKQKITDEIILTLAKIGKDLERHYYFPQDIEWAVDFKNTIFIVQTRPVTTLNQSPMTNTQSPKAENKKKLLVKGDPASPGIQSGPVQILGSMKDLDKINIGEVLVAEQTNPDYVPAMKKAVAIVTARGGRTSHAAIVSRELGIPAVVGVKNALSILKDGMVVTVNGSTGEVFQGSIASNIKNQISNIKKDENHNLKTATKVYVNLAEPSRADAVSKMNVDGVGLLRAEFMIAGIGTHPKKFIKDKKEKEFISILSSNLETICSALNPRPVVYRATDFRTNEYRNLKGGQEFEPVEDNPMLGFRGAARYIVDSSVFELELEAIKHVRNKLGFKNFSLMIPFVRNPKEMLEVKKIVASAGLSRGSTFKLWMMVEIPTNVILLDQYLDVGIDGVSIGSNDLTMLILGTDRDNSEVAHDFNEMDPAVLWAFEKVVTTCAKRGVTVSMCGQAPSDYPELVEKLVKWGITSVSVNPDALDSVRRTIFEAEQNLVKHASLNR
ncbi:phosphoenolpyruvate synthase [Candidatus Gottesmanbacteria bacterium]|nr:phosphoenolpyruvate synthase [Candidatus Gottesmanbacteria bacterium]